MVEAGVGTAGKINWPTGDRAAPELAIDPAARLEPEIARVVNPELAIDQVAAPTLVIDPAEAVLAQGQALAERVHVPVAAVLARGHPRDQPVVAARTKLVTAPHPRALPLLTAEDLVAAAVETTHVPAAAEAATAWEAAE